MRRKGIVFFVAVFLVTLLTLSAFRGLFLWTYSPAGGVEASDVISGLLRGARFDAKWTAISLIASLVTLLGGSVVARFGKGGALFRISEALAILGASALFILALVNFGFFGFYGSPINSLVFGFMQDDTWAIIVSVVRDWPVFQYLACLLIFVGILLWIRKKVSEKESDSTVASARQDFLALFCVILATVFFARGSFGTFPLRQTDLNATTNFFVNQAVNNGAQALYDAAKEVKAQDIGSNPLAGLRAMGFASEKEAETVIAPKTLTATKETRLPNIVLVVMEAMGRDLFEAYELKVNDTLGAFAEVAKRGDLFLNSISIQNGTFPSLEGLLFNTPISPISQSRYGYKPFSFSYVKEFKEAGYRTIYLSSGTSVWRNVDANFPRHGFDEILGLEHIKKRFGENIETGTWGVPDAYMFEYAKELLSAGEKEGKPLLIVCLSTTNHPPYKTPTGYAVKPVSYDALPAWKTKDKKIANAILETYQYAADSLGRFIRDTPQKIAEKTIFVATGDHNTRTIFEYPDTARLDHQFGVPLFFLVPEVWRPASPDRSRWTGHTDIFPTLRELVLKRTARPFEGVNVYGKDAGFALTFSQAAGGAGLVISKEGAVANLAHPQYFVRQNLAGTFTPTNAPSEGLKKLRNSAAARMGLADVRVRKGCLSQTP